MPKCKVCPDCGCNLDFGEKCDCREEKTAPDATTSESGQSKIN